MKGPGGITSCVQHMHTICSLHHPAIHRMKAPPGRLLQTSVRAAEASDALGSVRIASCSAELRSAASLRATCFSEDPPWGPNRAYQRMKASDAWDTLEAKIAGTETAFQGIAVTCLVACIDDDDSNPRAAAVRGCMDLSCKIPAGVCGSRLPQLVVATLDINRGINLPGEQLVGRQPPSVSAKTERAYLSNVCVAKAVRRLGFAQRLISAAISESQRAGTKWLYVHAAAENIAAVRLYVEHCGFTLEQEETEVQARRLSRPRRMLFSQQLH